MKGHCPGAAFPDTVQGAAGLRACPTAGHPGRPQPALPGWFNMERKRERKRQTGRGWPVLPPSCSGMLQAGIKVHRGKGRVRELEGGGHGGGAQASSRQRGIPQKRPLELHRKGKKEQERKRERDKGSQWQLSRRHRMKRYRAGVQVAGQPPGRLQDAARPLAGVQQHPKVVL